MKKLLALVLLFTSLLSLTSCGSSAGVEGQDKSSEAEQVFYEDENLKATFIDVIEQDIMPGYAYIRVTFENKSDGEITVLPIDYSVNDTIVQYASGMLATMGAGKKLNYAWFFPMTNAGINSVDEIETLEFSLEIDDEHMSQLAKSNLITIQVNNPA